MTGFKSLGLKDVPVLNYNNGNLKNFFFTYRDELIALLSNCQKAETAVHEHNFSISNHHSLQPVWNSQRILAVQIQGNNRQ